MHTKIYLIKTQAPLSPFSDHQIPVPFVSHKGYVMLEQNVTFTRLTVSIQIIMPTIGGPGTAQFRHG